MEKHIGNQKKLRNLKLQNHQSSKEKKKAVACKHEPPSYLDMGLKCYRESDGKSVTNRQSQKPKAEDTTNGGNQVKHGDHKPDTKRRPIDQTALMIQAA